MKITNKENLPQALVDAVMQDGYNRGECDWSTTQLGQPSRIIALKQMHETELEEDASDRIYSLVGQLGHSILERSGKADIIEKRLYHTMPDGTVISGQVDVVDKTILEDWKFTSTWVAAFGIKDDWIFQASVNAYLCHHNGIKITGCRYVAIFRDWSKARVRRERGYPKHQVQVFNIPIWSLADTEKWIMGRIASHKAAMVELPFCTDEDRWNRGAKTAVMKDGRKTAVKLFESEPDARLFISQQEKDKGKLRTEKRPGMNMRCELYCPVVKFCSAAKELGVEAAQPEYTAEDMFDNLEEESA